MLNAREASRMLGEMTPEQRSATLRDKVSEKTRLALDSKIREVIAAFETRVDIILDAEICKDADNDIVMLLQGLGYNTIKVASDFPAYCESYTGTTHIRFSIPTHL